ncbi:ABC transporter ATP-binding protein [Geomicrobium sp. JCM 19039]|uniref:ABC transporter ATP-binding protein n=1 Tax=Geomicrobium sp. JCM 19039 TaxID=1460636 RepID=UPI00045F1C06|nr:ABC transporter ATP-binding protein [Geomicrobium sp. JCM 19039]GAK10583.1 ABC transporter, ATP-binding protein [Geomicrobium sp. JCM 19039]
MMNIHIQDLVKIYDDRRVLNDVTLTILENQTFAILGRNGAGKTTLMECLIGLTSYDSGSLSINGKQVSSIRNSVGVQLQNHAMFERTTVQELYSLFASFYSKPISPDHLLDLLHLDALKHQRIHKLSTGQKQRTAIGLALIGDPKVILLDEPTAGLDVQVRELIWEVLADMKAKGKTIVFTTHYMEEAEQFSDQVAVLHEGAILDIDTSEQLIRKYANKNKQTLNEAFKSLTGSTMRTGVD